MITVVSMNPAIDKRLVITRFTKGNIHRAQSTQNRAGGKGIHVASTASRLGSAVTITGFLPKLGAQVIINELKQERIIPSFIEVPGEIRTCLAIFDTNDQSETEILEPGCFIEQEHLTSLKSRVEHLARQSEVVVFSGSLPLGIPTDTYAELIHICTGSGCKAILDTSGEALQQGIKGRPFAVKPNQQEIQELVNSPVQDLSDACQASRYLSETYNISLVIISLGKKGVVINDSGEICTASPPSIITRNTVGSGDCLVGGFAHGMEKQLLLEKATRIAVACGAANAASEITGMIDTALVNDLENQVVITKWHESSGVVFALSDRL